MAAVNGLQIRMMFMKLITKEGWQVKLKRQDKTQDKRVEDSENYLKYKTGWIEQIVQEKSVNQ